MITLKPATSRLPVRAASTAFAALLALGLPLAAQSRGHGGGGGGGSAHSSGGGSHSSSGGGHSSGGSGSHSGGSHSGGRTAHGSGSSSGGQRQPGHGGYHGGSGGSHGGHGGHGGGYWRGGHFYYYPFGWGFGFWPGYYWDGWYGGDPYYAPSYSDGDGYGYGYDDERESGALDLDVSPGRTHIFVNGEDLGIVDRYDGWPGYLWLPEGTYDVAFYLPGYKTIARQITVHPGSVIDLDDRMEKGDAVRPEDLISKTHVRRDERLRFEHERQQRLDRQNGDDDQDWRDRVRHDRGQMRNRDDDQGDDDHDGRADSHADGRDRDSGGAHLRLSVEPQDASVYLDGQFVGTGSDLSLLHAGLQVAPGHHKLAIVRPGHKAVEKDFDAKAGGDVALEISLEAGSGM